MKNALLFIIAITISGGAGYLLQRSISEHGQTSNTAIGQQRPEFAAIDLKGKIRNIKEWDGKVILLNFWATWCPPCRREIPDLIKLQNAFHHDDFQIIGVAIDEDSAVREFVTKMGINYPIMPVQADAAELARRYGNTSGGLPYSVFINKKGEISATITGELNKKRATTLLKQLGIEPI